MPTVTASIASLILTLDDPGRDDLTTVRVWASTTSGFTPGAGNLVYTGDALTIVIANLTPLTTYYLRFAYISEIDPDDFELSTELSGIPNKIDGSIIVDGSITADQISATALRGKMLAGNVIVDEGTLLTSAINYSDYTVDWTDVTTTVTLNVLDTSDFPPIGAAVIVSINPPSSGLDWLNGGAPYFVAYVRYTGKTETTLTGVSGFNSYGVPADQTFPVGSAVIPFTPCTAVLNNYTVESDPWGLSSLSGWDGATLPGWYWRVSGGNAIAVSIDQSSPVVADLFTYTAGDGDSTYTSIPGFRGVSGLAAWSNTPKVIFDNPGFPNCVIPSGGGNFTTLTTTTSNNQYLRSSGGTILLASTTVVGFYEARYLSYSGTTITLDKETYLDGGTYRIIPLFSRNAFNASFPWFSISNASTIYLATSYLSPGKTNFETAVTINQSQAPSDYGSPSLRLLPSPNQYAIEISRSDNGLFPFFDASSISQTSYVSQTGGAFGPVYDDNTGAYYLGWDDGNGTLRVGQVMDTTHRFGLPWSTSDYGDIIFSSATYNFTSAGGDGNAYLKAFHVALGEASTSSSIVINSTKSISVNGTRYGINNVLIGTNTALTADRSLFGARNYVELQYQNSLARNVTAYGSYNNVATSLTAGNSINGEGNIFGSYNYALHNTDDATFTRMENAYGSYNYAYSAGNTSQVDQAYGVYSYVRTGGSAASATTAIVTAYGYYGLVSASTVNRNITTAYIMYLDSSETGTVTNKWGLYVDSTWPNYFAGNVTMNAAVNITPTVVTPVAAGTTTFTTSTSVVACNHTATIASHTFAFPTTSLNNGQQITISTRSAITTVTLSGGTFYGAITTLAAGGFAQYTYSSTAAAWFRTGG